MRVITFGGLAFLLVVGNLEISAEMVTAGGNSYYIEREKQVNWHEAWNICASIQMNLVTMDTQPKSDNLSPNLSGDETTFYWTSGNELAKPDSNNDNRNFVWGATGLPTTYVKWGDNQPNNLEGTCSCHCLAMSKSGKISDKPCDKAMLFICEY